MPESTTPAPGLHYNVEEADYHAWPGLAQSMLSHLAHTPAHLFDYLNQRDQYKSTAAQQVGTAVHKRVLEPDGFKDQYIIGPEVDARTKEFKQFKAAAESKGRRVLTAKEGAWVDAIARSIKDSRWFQSQSKLDGVIVEASAVWEMDQYLCRGRFDMIVPERKLMIDLKTTNSSFDNFKFSIRQFHYAWQAYWYMKGAENLGIDIDTFVMAALHKERPFLVSYHEIRRDSQVFDDAAVEVENLFDKYKDCMRTGVWEGYPQDPVPVLPDKVDPQRPVVLVETTF